jgi:hypothetical protein
MSLPLSHRAGDLLEFTAPGDMTSRCILRHSVTGRIYEVTASSVSGDEATFIFQPSETASAPVGTYAVAIITETGGRSTEQIGTLNVLVPFDRAPQESHARLMVGLLEAHLQGRIADDKGRGIESYTVAGVPISKIPIQEAALLLTNYRVQLAADEDKERAGLGLSNRRIIRTRFTR